MSRQSGWWKVEASLVIRAASEDAAINLAAEAIRHGYESARGVMPVGTFKARPHRDHMTDAVDRLDPLVEEEAK